MHAERRLQDTWDHNVPAVYFAVTYVLCLVMCFAVSVMLGWHLYAVAQAETAVEVRVILPVTCTPSSD